MQWWIQDFPEENFNLGHHTIILANFPPELNDSENIWAERGHVSLAPPLDPPIT